MYSLYRLNTDELSNDFVDALKRLFPHKTIEISVCESEGAASDETTYLLADPANRLRLLEAIENVANRRDLVTVKLDDLQ